MQWNGDHHLGTEIAQSGRVLNIHPLHECLSQAHARQALQTEAGGLEIVLVRTQPEDLLESESLTGTLIASFRSARMWSNGRRTPPAASILRTVRKSGLAGEAEGFVLDRIATIAAGRWVEKPKHSFRESADMLT
jgi:hypothetical protein